MVITRDTKIIYRNELGKEIEFSLFSSYLLERFNDELKNNIISEKTNVYHGNRYIFSSLESRYIEITGAIEKNSSAEISRLKFFKTLNLTLEGKIILSNKDTEKEIDVRLEEMPTITSETGMTRFHISLVAFNPFWKNKEKVEYIALLTKNLTFPLVIYNKMYFGLRKSTLETEVENIGDVESGFRVVFKARSGTVKNPKIFNKVTGEYIKVNYQMEKGDVIEIVNLPELKKITINHLTNGFKHLNIDSTFFNLDVGKNLVGYLADENTTNLDVIVYYTPRFLGV